MNRHTVHHLTPCFQKAIATVNEDPHSVSPLNPAAAFGGALRKSNLHCEAWLNLGIQLAL